MSKQFLYWIKDLQFPGKISDTLVSNEFHCHKGDLCTKVKVAVVTVRVWSSNGERSWGKPRSWGRHSDGRNLPQEEVCVLPWPYHGTEERQ